HLPPLRDRREDVPALAEHFLRQIRPPQDGAPWKISDDLHREMCARSWAGNVRELRNAVEHAAIVARGGELRPENLPEPAPMSSAARHSVRDRTRAEIALWTADEAERLAGSDDPQLYERFLQLV